MIKLRDLMDKIAAKNVTLHVPVTYNLNTRVDFQIGDTAICEDVDALYGGREVRSISIIYNEHRLELMLGKDVKDDD